MDPTEEYGREARGPTGRMSAGEGGGYHEDAYTFVLEAVSFTLRDIGEKRHITGRELCEGAQKLARERFGPMAKEVLNFWGVRSTGDIGVIVFRLVDAGELSTTEGDSIDDFLDVYDFNEAFERDYFA